MIRIQKKLVLFGAGKIGRSFIGQVFSRSGYEVVFVDINQQVIDKLNECRQYKVIVKSREKNETILITNVRGIHLSQVEKVTEELACASIAALSVGQQGLPAALPLIAKALVLRKQKYDEWPLDIIIAENMRNADQYIRTELIKLLPEDYPHDKLVGLVETSIGKMVPIMTQKDMEEDALQVFAEQYNSLIVAKNSFKNPISDVSYLSPKENIKAWVDRKLFIHNLGHATAAYLGFRKNPNWVFMYEVLNDPEIHEATRQTMLQSADILTSLYPEEFTRSQLEVHINDLLERFQNKALGDTLFRIGCDLQRKLSAEDRLAIAIHVARDMKLPYHLILKALVSGCHFMATDEHGNRLTSDHEFDLIYAKGIKKVLTSISGFDEVIDHEVIAEAIALDNSLKL
ncbi:MAG: mannitol-1-phosphate 5-dehydrogenase [Bacteroidota bacterium]|nr:mannitol-1-phosphate 5-dehydrogenase [Bacteroidota bacterium]